MTWRMAACLDARYLGVGDFVQNLGRTRDDIASGTPSRHRLRILFDDLAFTI